MSNIVQLLLFTAYAIAAVLVILVIPITILPPVLLFLLSVFVLISEIAGTCTNVILFTQKLE